MYIMHRVPYFLDVQEWKAYSARFNEISFLKQFRAWLTSTAIRILQKLISGDIQPRGGQLDDLLGSFTPTSTVGTECSNNWYLYKRGLQLAVANLSEHIIENCLHVKLARTRSFPRETYVTGGIVFIFLREHSQVDRVALLCHFRQPRTCSRVQSLSLTCLYNSTLLVTC